MVTWLEATAHAAVLVFVVAGMAAAGLGLSPAAVVAPLRRPRTVLAALAANFVVAPAVAVGLAAALPLDRPYEVGLLLLGGGGRGPVPPPARGRRGR